MCRRQVLSLLSAFSMRHVYKPSSCRLTLGKDRSSVMLGPCRLVIVALGWVRGARLRLAQGTVVGSSAGLDAFSTRYQLRLEYSTRSTTQRSNTSSSSMGVLEGNTLRLRKPGEENTNCVNVWHMIKFTNRTYFKRLTIIKKCYKIVFILYTFLK